MTNTTENQTENIATNIAKTKLASQVLESRTLKQIELDKVMSRTIKKNPVKEVLEINEYSDAYAEWIKGKSQGDVKKEQSAFRHMKLLQTTELLVRTHLHQLVAMSEATYQTAYNGANTADKVQWEIWRPRWFGFRQRINLEDQVYANFESEEGIAETKKYVSQLLIEDILKQAKQYKDNARVGYSVYNDKQEKHQLVESKPFRTWFHNEYNASGAVYSTRLDLIKNLAEGNYEEAFDGIDFVSITPEEREQIVQQLAPKTQGRK